MITLAKIRSKLPLIIMLAIVFLGTISMTIVLPVLPFIIQNHVHDAKNVALWVGVLETVFSACALVSAPILGALSDRIGRKPVLVVSLLGSAVGYVLFGIAGGLAILVVSRVIDGISLSPASIGDPVAFSGHATDSLGHAITAYQWRSSLSWQLSITLIWVMLSDSTATSAGATVVRRVRTQSMKLPMWWRLS